MTAASTYTLAMGFTGCICITTTVLFKLGDTEDGVPRTMPWRRLEKYGGADLSDIPEDMQRTLQSSEVANAD